MTDPIPGTGPYTADFELKHRGAPPRKLIMTQLPVPHAPAPVTFIEQTHVCTGWIDDDIVKGCSLMLYTPDKPLGFMLVMDAETVRDLIGWLDRVASSLEAAAAATATTLLNQLRADKGDAA